MMKDFPSPLRHGQQGATLLVGLIMLVLMTLLALSAFNMGRGNLQVVNNMQNHNDNYNAAQEALEETISNTRFFDSPTAVFLTPCTGSNTKCYSVNGSGKNDITVTIGSSSDPTKPTCIKAQPVSNAQLNLANPNDLGCSMGQSQSFGIAGSATGNSLCADSLWDIQADAVDSVTQAHVVANAGVSVRVSADNIAVSCP